MGRWPCPPGQSRVLLAEAAAGAQDRAAWKHVAIAWHAVFSLDSLSRKVRRPHPWDIQEPSVQQTVSPAFPPYSCLGRAWLQHHRAVPCTERPLWQLVIEVKSITGDSETESSGAKLGMQGMRDSRLCLRSVRTESATRAELVPAQSTFPWGVLPGIGFFHLHGLSALGITQFLAKPWLDFPRPRHVGYPALGTVPGGEVPRLRLGSAPCLACVECCPAAPGPKPRALSCLCPPDEFPQPHPSLRHLRRGWSPAVLGAFPPACPVRSLALRFCVELSAGRELSSGSKPGQCPDCCQHFPAPRSLAP